MNTRRILWSFAFVASVANGATADPTPAVSFAPGLLQATFGLAVVLALIWGAAWLTRRFRPAGSSSRSPIKLVATQALGQRERVVLIEIGEEWLLLGVAPGQVSALHTGPRSLLPQPDAPIAAPFAKLLARAMRKDKTQ